MTSTNNINCPSQGFFLLVSLYVTHGDMVPLSHLYLFVLPNFSWHAWQGWPACMSMETAALVLLTICIELFNTCMVWLAINWRLSIYLSVRPLFTCDIADSAKRVGMFSNANDYISRLPVSLDRWGLSTRCRFEERSSKGVLTKVAFSFFFFASFTSMEEIQGDRAFNHGDL